MTKGRDARRSREEVEALVGKRTPLPGGARQLSPQMLQRQVAAEVARRRVAEDDRPGVDPQVSLDPRRTNMMRMSRAGLEGPSDALERVPPAPRPRGYAKGGSVRGNGCASKGKTRGTMR